MKFLLDANVRHGVGKLLEAGRVLLTNDQDFGNLIYQHHHQHAGVILFRLPEAYETDQDYFRRLLRVLEMPEETVVGRFVVITNEHLRVR